MLTANLVRSRISDREVTPLFINPDDARYRETAIELFETHVGELKADLDTAIDQLTVADTDYKTIQGLAKLLRDEYDFETVAAAEPRECSGSKPVSMSTMWSTSQRSMQFQALSADP